jgi:hypothetical protein
LNRQFEDTIVSFEGYVDSMDEMEASYIPELDEIQVYIHKSAPLNTIEALVQHEIIHMMQDDSSGMRMAKSIEKERKAQLAVSKQIMKLQKKKKKTPQDEEKITELIKQLENLEVKRAFDNHEEKMTYAYMAVKMRGSDNPKEVIDDFNKWWVNMTGKKMDKQMLKYFGSYWMVKEKL